MNLVLKFFIHFQSPAPGPYVKEMNDAGQFYTNRVLKDSKDSRASKDWNAPPNSHVDWTKSWVSTLVNLQALVKQFHTTGLVWNPKGGDAKAQTGILVYFLNNREICNMVENCSLLFYDKY